MGFWGILVAQSITDARKTERESRGLQPYCAGALCSEQFVRSKRPARSALQLQSKDLIAITNLASCSVDASDNRFGQNPVFPFHVHFKAATRAQPFRGSARPCLRQRRQQVNLARVRLQEHLGDSRGGAEIAVDLKWRVGVE